MLARTPNFFDHRIGRARNLLLHSLHPTIFVIRLSRFFKRSLWLLVAVPLVFAIGYFGALTTRIANQSTRDEARPADMIIVMGAAEYRGRPSPVFKARLDHALSLFTKGMAPLLMTTGGAGGDPQFTEATVGRAYLIDRGVPSERIVVESQGDSTVYSISAAAEIMHRMGLRSCILVSDGYHIFRAKRMMQARGISVYGSPRSSTAPTSPIRQYWLYVKQAVGYALWKIGVSV